MRLRFVIVLGALSVALSSCGIALQNLPKIGGVSGPTYSITATFANVVNLPANAEVRVGGFAVGFVSNIETKNFVAIITMKVKKAVELPVGTSAQIAFDTPLGEDYVLLQPPSKPRTGTGDLANGGQIPETATATAPSVEDTLGALGGLLNGGGIDQVQTIIDQTNLALNGNQPQIRALLNSLNATVTAFADASPSLDNALTAIASLSKVLDQGRGTIDQGLTALAPSVTVLANENGNLDSLLAQLDRLSAVANNIINSSFNGTIQTVQGLLPLLQQLTSVQQQLSPALTALNAVETNTPNAIPGDYVQLDITADVQVPPVPSDALPLHKVTVDPPDPTESYDASGIATVLEGGLP